MDIFLNSTLLVALAEIGDKTQLLAIMLAARYPGKTLQLVMGITLAVAANHFFSALLGQYIGSTAPSWLQWVLAASFIAMGLWILKPDSMEDNPNLKEYGAFATTFVTFFLGEMGDKTQLATVALAAEYKHMLPVLMGTITGRLVADVPMVFFGQAILARIPMRYVRWCASLLFIGMGATLLWPLLVK